MKKINIIFFIIIAFVFCSGFSIPSANSWKDYYEKNKSEINKSLFCQYRTSGTLAGTINWISFDATEHSLMITFNEGQSLNPNSQIFSEDDNSPNAANNQISGTQNLLLLYNYKMNEVCPSNIYLYVYDVYGDGSYYTVNMVSSPNDLENTSDYQGYVTYTRGEPVKDNYDRAEDNITSDGNIQHPNGSVTAGDGSTLKEEFGNADDVSYNNVEGMNFCSEDSVKMTLNIIGYVVFSLKMIVPLLLIIMGSLDFSKALISSDDKAIKDALGKLIRRIIAGIIVFFIPTILNYAFSLINEVSNNQANFTQCSSCLFTPFNGCSYKKLGE